MIPWIQAIGRESQSCIVGHSGNIRLGPNAFESRVFSARSFIAQSVACIGTQQERLQYRIDGVAILPKKNPLSRAPGLRPTIDLYQLARRRAQDLFNAFLPIFGRHPLHCRQDKSLPILGWALPKLIKCSFAGRFAVVIKCLKRSNQMKWSRPLHFELPPAL